MRVLATVLLWAGLAVALAASGQPWWAAGSNVEAGTSATSGASLALILAALAGAFLAGWLRPSARRIVLVLVVLLAGVAAGVAVSTSAPDALAGSRLNNAVVGPTPWRWVYVSAAVAALCGGVLSWFVRPSGARSAATPDPAREAWKALDAGEDPTASERGAGGDSARDQQQ